VFIEVPLNCGVDVCARGTRADGVERRLLRREHVVEEEPHSIGRRPDDHGPLELRLIAPDRCTGLGDEDVPLLEPDVVCNGVRPGAPATDLSAVAGLCAVTRPEQPSRAVLLEHCERRRLLRLQARLRLGDAGTGVLLQTRVRVCAPAAALADELDLRRTLARHHRLDLRLNAYDFRAGDLAQRRPLIAEDSRVAVLIRRDSPFQAELGHDAGEDLHRVLQPGVLGI
jgi:hypothetical protein